ncbi:uncharacterized protein MONBRDRAFT_18849 [Monosiga brevicollis MX1]|uniref:Gluconokinase n=1 Tax=Monosiga brevicollis TaxID=81824 RepID=A9UY10_MONBE|nr:uncharacterized protein MONBRDRAFT_18849 [Monosiga brevicollis MX1]EDQ89941.1 predicted protein [Monosiga brevicollis MX1]|eukprot:XP_001745363.1 hypothetical protein [Monosiga brevicollis MX1]
MAAHTSNAPGLGCKPVVVVMGVSGSGKSTVGIRLAEALHVTFVDGDHLHPAANVAKMQAGQPLTDEDRIPWLQAINQRLTAAHVDGTGLVVACSALRRAYREMLRTGLAENLVFVYLEGSPELIGSRVKQRVGHFMPVKLLDSQFATLEPPTGEPRVITCPVATPLDALVADATAHPLLATT